MTDAASTPEPTEITVDVDVNSRCVTVCGCLDVRTGPVLAQTVAAVFPAPDGDIVLDLHSLGFLDAAGMSSLVHINNALRPAGRRLVLRAVSARHRRILIVAGLRCLLPISCARLRSGPSLSRASLAARSNQRVRPSQHEQGTVG